MPRAKKDGKFLNCYVDKEILEKLEQYCEKTSIPKTSVVEKALSQYLKADGALRRVEKQQAFRKDGKMERKTFIMEKTLRELAPSGKNIYVNYKRNTMAVAMGTIDELERYWNCEGILSKEGRMGYQFTITHERR